MVSRKLFVLASVALMGGLALSGCGEQDLYEPPVSPYGITGRIPLPSEALGVDILGNYAYIADSEAGLAVIDLTDSSNPHLLYWRASATDADLYLTADDPEASGVLSTIDTKKDAEAIRVARTYDANGTQRDIAFLVDGTEGITTFDITDVPNSIRDFRQGTTAVDGIKICVVPAEFIGDGYTVYLADSWKGVRVFFSDPLVPGALDYRAFAGTYGYTKALDVVDGFAYVADNQMGLTVLDVNSVRTGGLTIVDNEDTPGEALDVDVDGGYAFIADNQGGLQIMAIDEQNRIDLIASLPLNGDCVGIEVREGYAFIAAEDGGLHVVNISNPHSPTQAGSVVTEAAVGVAVGEGNVVCIADEVEGLVVFQGPRLTADHVAPAAVTGLTARLYHTGSLSLSWTAPGDDGTVGTAELYEMRGSLDPITEENFDDPGVTWEILRRPLPAEAGTAQSFDILNLTAGETYFYALMTKDESLNWSEISNVAMAIMTTPLLSNGTVDPDSADIGTEFTYTVVYTDGENDAPAVSNVIIDGEPRAMSLVASGANPDSLYINGATFSFSMVLERGSHTYRFAFDDGHGPLVETTTASGPKLPEDPFAYDMIQIDPRSAGAFSMGSAQGELGRENDETQHAVTLTAPYFIADIEVTQVLYREIMASQGSNAAPSFFPGDPLPVERVTWYDAVRFCNAYSEHDEYDPVYTITGETYDPEGRLIAAYVVWNPAANGYRLPTEAEWEYACRAGEITSLANGELTHEYCDVDPLLDLIGIYCGNADAGAGLRTADRRTRDANGLGLYDMHGNVWEWCWDPYFAFTEDPVSDPFMPGEDALGEQRVRRGGSWRYFARECRSASRGAFWPGSADNTIGLRIARNATDE